MARNSSSSNVFADIVFGVFGDLVGLVHNRISDAGHPILAKIVVLVLVALPFLIAYSVWLLHPENPFSSTSSPG